jgi:hypothetical protein
VQNFSQYIQSQSRESHLGPPDHVAGKLITLQRLQILSLLELKASSRYSRVTISISDSCFSHLFITIRRAGIAQSV